MLEMLALAVKHHACRESFAKAQSRFADYFTRQIVSNSTQKNFRIRYVP